MSTPICIIRNKAFSFLPSFSELFRYKDLLLFLILRDIKVRYVQSVLGIAWAMIQPVFSMFLFTFIFAKLAKIESDSIPYPLFSYTALIPWTYFSSTLGEAANSLLSNAQMLGKVYFPRAILPGAVVGAKLLDFLISLSLLSFLYGYYSMFPSWNLMYLPVMTLILITFTLGCSLWLSALCIQYRDIRYGLSFFLQLFQYLCPVVYPLSLLPNSLKNLSILNPMAGIIEGFRACLCTAECPSTKVILSSLVGSLIFFMSGSIYFSNKEKLFADVI
jgi:lipopolysaccharide transport system permease protein